MMMRARYGIWTVDGEIHPSQDASFLWRKICAYAPKVISQTRWLVDDNQSVRLLCDQWVNDLRLSRWPTFINHEVMDSMRFLTSSEQMMASGILWQLPISLGGSWGSGF